MPSDKGEALKKLRSVNEVCMVSILPVLATGMSLTWCEMESRTPSLFLEIGVGALREMNMSELDDVDVTLLTLVLPTIWLVLVCPSFHLSSSLSSSHSHFCFLHRPTRIYLERAAYFLQYSPLKNICTHIFHHDLLNYPLQQPKCLSCHHPSHYCHCHH